MAARAHQAPVDPELLQQEGCVLFGCLTVVFAAQDARCEGERAEHEAVPGGEHLLVASRANALLTLGEELRWEAGTGGEAYPHYYGALPMNAVTEATPVRSTS